MVSKGLKSVSMFIYIGVIVTLVAGCIGGYQQPNRDIGIIKVDNNGLKEWCTIVDSNEDDFAESIIQTSDEGFAVAGTMALKGAINSHPRLIKLYANGTVEWDQSYYQFQDRLGKVLQTETGDYIGLTYHYKDLLSLDRKGNFKSQLDSNISETYFPPHPISLPNTTFEIQAPIIQTREGGFLIAGFPKSYGYGFYGTFGGYSPSLISLDPSGKIIWNRTVESAGTWNTINNLIQTNDGGYAILVTRSSWERKVNPSPKRCDDPAPPPPK